MIRVAVIVPTTYSRPEYLDATVDSIMSQEGNFYLHLIIGCPANKVEAVQERFGRFANVIAEPQHGGLACKLDYFLRSSPENTNYMTWLGDDDLLHVGSLDAAVSALKKNPDCVLAYGGCDYINSKGKLLGRNPSGRWAARMLAFGPQLIPQPGSLFTRDAYFRAGGLNHDFDLAFDFDLFLRLRRLGNFKYLNRLLAQFRWHENSLSVKMRMRSAVEASRARRLNYRGLASIAWPIWEPAIVLITWFAGKVASMRASSSIQ